MTKTTTPELNRLRAAAGLIPIIESGLEEGKLSESRAEQMAAFCAWAAEVQVSTEEEQSLKNIVVQGLGRLQARWAALTESDPADVTMEGA